MARERLGVTPEMMVGVRKITPLLMKATGGIAAVIEALEMYDTPDAITFLAKWNSVSESDRERLTIEEITVAAGLTPLRLVELSTAALVQFGQDAEKLIVASSRAKIISTMVKMAESDFGDKDRENFLKGRSVGWFPEPKGLNVAIDNRTQNNTLNGLPGAAEERALPPPTADSFLLEMQSAIRPEQRLIEAPVPTVSATIPDVEYMDEDI